MLDVASTLVLRPEFFSVEFTDKVEEAAAKDDDVGDNHDDEEDASVKATGVKTAGLANGLLLIELVVLVLGANVWLVLVAPDGPLLAALGDRADDSVENDELYVLGRD